jgi:hypothetical protein
VRLQQIFHLSTDRRISGTSLLKIGITLATWIERKSCQKVLLNFNGITIHSFVLNPSLLTIDD